MRRATGAALLRVLLAGLPQPAAGAGPECPAWQTDTESRLAELRAELVRLVNERRHAAGAANVQLEPRLSTIAQAHAVHQARLGTMAHRTAETGGIEDRVRSAAIRDWDMVGENLAQGRPITYTSRNDDGSDPTVACHTPQSLAFDIVRAWDASPGHSRTLRERAFTHLGSGAAFLPERETVYVVHDFARLVSCGYLGAGCCPPPAGLSGGICQVPTHCRLGTCVVPPPPSAPPR